MRPSRYLHTILTVLAVLLALQLWTSWSGPSTPVLAAPAESGAKPGAATGIPDEGAQRKEMIDLLKRQVQQNEELIALLKSGQVRVKLEAAPRDAKE